MKLAFAKSGIGIGKVHLSKVLTHENAEDFFRSIEEKVARREEDR